MRVLILDDDLDSADTLGEVISIHGFEVAVAYSGTQAMELADTFQPQALICDLKMPKMSGYEFCARLRERQGKLPHLVIGYSGLAPVDLPQEPRTGYFTHYFMKPAHLPDLLEVLTGDWDESDEMSGRSCEETKRM